MKPFQLKFKVHCSLNVQSLRTKGLEREPDQTLHDAAESTANRQRSPRDDQQPVALLIGLRVLRAQELAGRQNPVASSEADIVQYQYRRSDAQRDNAEFEARCIHYSFILAGTLQASDQKQ